MSSSVITNFEIEDPREPPREPGVKHPVLYGAFVVTTLLAPYVSGVVILTQKNKLEDWGWI